MSITELFRDKDFLVKLLNDHCPPRNSKDTGAPVNIDWIDMEASEQVTAAYHRLLPDGMPYLTYVIVERNPDTKFGGTCVDANEKRLRYIIVAVLPDTEFPFNYSFPLIHEMWQFALFCWDTIRATLAACTKEMQVLLVAELVPPILNSARIEWTTLYLGRIPYCGISKISEQYASAEDFNGLEVDVNLFKVREMESSPVLDRLIAAYEADFPQADAGQSDQQTVNQCLE